jgi:23S rRNA (adenine2503-C2)-methyltransferase
LKKLLTNFTKQELSHLIKPPFRAKQIYQWVYQKYVDGFEFMNNLPKDLKQNLEENYELKALGIKTIETSKDGTKKYLFELNDGYTIETVLIPMKEEIKDENGNIVQGSRYTICVSSQVGCKIGCKFCYTAKGGFKRNLSAGEIVSQVLEVKKDNNIPHNKSVNIVFMGMGEPLDNFDNIIKSIDIFQDLDGLAISVRRQTISTSGLSDKITKLGELNTGVLLAISLHAVDDTTREALMPINKAYNIKSVIQAVKHFPIDARKRVMFEYLVIKNINDSIKNAKQLVALLDGIKAKVNLILFNSHPGSEFQKPNMSNVIKFQDYLSSKGIVCTIRASKGNDISAACGQLKEKENK